MTQSAASTTIERAPDEVQRCLTAWNVAVARQGLPYRAQAMLVRRPNGLPPVCRLRVTLGEGKVGTLSLGETDEHTVRAAIATILRASGVTDPP